VAQQGAGNGRGRVAESARRDVRFALQLRGRELPQMIAAAHQAGVLVRLDQRVHAAAQAVLVPVLAGAEVSTASGPDPTERFSA
jgi:hypothetical protein